MDGFAWIEGFIYGKDFPDVVATIRYYNGLAAEHNWSDYQFGASLEMEASVQGAPDDENILDVIEFCGTGAAILFAEAAAYKTTSFAAKGKKSNTETEEVEMTPEQIKAMQDALKAVTEGMTTLTASVQSVASEVGTIKTEVAEMKASKEQEKQQTAEEKAAADLQAAKDEAERLKQELADLKAGKREKEEPARKTVAASQLLSKYGGAGGKEEATDYKSFCASVDALNLPATDSFRLKMQAKEQFKKDGE
jgi:uncharacterized phage infection (PIP) family protein YhgE